MGMYISLILSEEEHLRETSGISGLKNNNSHNFSILPPMKLIYSSQCSSFQELFNGTGDCRIFAPGRQRAQMTGYCMQSPQDYYKQLDMPNKEHFMLFGFCLLVQRFCNPQYIVIALCNKPVHIRILLSGWVNHTYIGLTYHRNFCVLAIASIGIALMEGLFLKKFWGGRYPIRAPFLASKVYISPPDFFKNNPSVSFIELCL